ncbi:MAG: 4-(cytidine 5'-diphospho)-2-C-methyl-D-erythritol kinase [Planctomycetota bacterium]|nr:4-(cytidine 5'-diphospho)-2-C-methyl-D-erythritol kinase [Planctomycetota bacterium]
MTSFTIESYAKINLFLEVLGPRDDGFHDLDTIFCEIDWSDTLHFSSLENSGVTLACSAPDFPLGPENLISKALTPFLANSSKGAHVEIIKRLPMGGGLGGGSSNAAVALMAGERLFDSELPKGERAKRALELGSDVPFFLEGACQRGLGRGERLTHSPLPNLDLVLLTPGVHCSTAKVFQTLKKNRRSLHSVKEMLRAIEAGDNEGIARALFNRLEEPSFEHWPELARCKEELLARGCLGALMSGSGSSIFGIARDQAHSETLAAEMDNAQAMSTKARAAG